MNILYVLYGDFSSNSTNPLFDSTIKRYLNLKVLTEEEFLQFCSGITEGACESVTESSK